MAEILWFNNGLNKRNMNRYCKKKLKAVINYQNKNIKNINFEIGRAAHPYNLMSRRVHANAHEFDNTAYNSENFQENFNYYESSQDFQQNYNYESNIHYGGPQNVMNSAPHGQNPDYNNHYSNNNMNFHESGANHQTSNNGAYNHISQDRHSPVIKASFPIVQPPALVQPTGPIQNYGTQYNSASNSEKSWISAFGSGGFDNEPPLLEGI